MTAMSTEAPTDATKELRASVSMGVPRHTLWATPTVAIHAAFTGLHVTQQDTVLDIGCGDITHYLAPRAFPIRRPSISETKIEVAMSPMCDDG